MQRLEGPLGYVKVYTSKNTLNNTNGALRSFFAAIYGDGEDLNKLAERYFSEHRDYEKDVQVFILEIKDYSPSTIRSKVSNVRTFLAENNVELSSRFWKRQLVRIRGTRALTRDKIPSDKEMRQIMSHLPVHGKAFFSVMVSSGMRIGEAAHLEPEDLELDSDPAKVYVRAEWTRTKNRRVTFISSEAKEFLLEWLKVRDGWLDAAARKTKGLNPNKSVDDPRVFPFTEVLAYKVWHRALKRSKLDERDRNTKYHRIHPHVLRKFFRTKLGAVIPVDVVEALMGHEGYLTREYRTYSEEDLAKYYKKGESVLLVFAQGSQIDERTKALEYENRTLRTQVEQNRDEITQLKEKLWETIKMLDKYFRDFPGEG